MSWEWVTDLAQGVLSDLAPIVMLRPQLDKPCSNLARGDKRRPSSRKQTPTWLNEPKYEALNQLKEKNSMFYTRKANKIRLQTRNVARCSTHRLLS